MSRCSPPPNCSQQAITFSNGLPTRTTRRKNIIRRLSIRIPRSSCRDINNELKAIKRAVTALACHGSFLFPSHGIHSPLQPVNIIVRQNTLYYFFIDPPLFEYCSKSQDLGLALPRRISFDYFP